MRENFPGAANHERQQSEQSPEAPKTTEEAQLGERVEESAAPSSDGREQRIAIIDAKREDELTKLNAARARLGLSPSDTSVAIAAFDRERTLLANAQRERGNEKLTETGNALKSIAGVDEKSRITPEIRYYFTKILGPEEAARRMRKMQEVGPKTVARVRNDVESGNLHAVVSAFTSHDPAVQEREQEIRRLWRKTAPLDPYGYPDGMAYPENNVRFDKMLDAVQRSIRGAQLGHEAPSESQNHRDDRPVSETEHAIKDKIAKIPDELTSLKRLLSMSSETRRLLIDDERLLKANPETLRRWNSYFDKPTG